MSCADYLEQYRGLAFPDIFYTFMHPFISSLNDCVSVTPIPPIPSPGVSTPNGPHASGEVAGAYGTLRSDADERIERVWSEWEMIQEHLDRDAGREERGTQVEDNSDRLPVTQTDQDTYVSQTSARFSLSSSTDSRRSAEPVSDQVTSPWSGRSNR